MAQEVQAQMEESGMTVDELIHKLAKWPGNFEVYAYNINGDYRRVEDVDKDDQYNDLLIVARDRE